MLVTYHDAPKAEFSLFLNFWSPLTVFALSLICNFDNIRNSFSFPEDANHSTSVILLASCALKCSAHASSLSVNFC